MSAGLAPQLRALGFVRNPFPQTPDADCYFRTPDIERQFAEVEHCLVTGKGFVLLTGEIGTGKSTFLRSLIDKLLDADCRLAYVFNTFLKGRDLLLAINRDFGLEPGVDMADDLDRLNRFLIEANGRGQACVVLIDDAQNFDIATLELVRLLSNLETRQHKLLQIVLSGQPELAQLLAQPSIRQLASRIVQHVQLAPLSQQDCTRYIEFRITHCLGDASAPITIDDAACRALYRHANGNPRRMHLILDRCLYGVMTRTERSIDAALIDTAAAEAGMFPHPSAPPVPVMQSRTVRPSMRTLIATAVAGCSVALTAWAVVQAKPSGLNAPAMPATVAIAGDNEKSALRGCLDALDASAWVPVLEAGIDGGMQPATRDALPHALAAHGLAIAAAPSGNRLATPHCAWRDQAGAWVLWRPKHTPYALQDGAPDATRMLQARLAAAGFYRDELDGMPGPRSRDALSRYRAHHGLPATPLLDGATLLLLEQETASAANGKDESRMTTR
ncbi:MAG TPA: AAA family ATPase [Noviherbaspirillum sp.]|jgi:general secretion pathway protein A|uniref:AAA family ATPase n=1 Tax=Noviherbaspirillum sp. TaxID=1926288 RepID=UPI002DDD076D|nr:AAA family ATPase [Noviherbaspirillum sp.]HEV2612297.1 AAA family ATPase [Noviherbaspirillum sp.]